MTLESVVVDCKGARIPGQVGVALGRAKSIENLQVKNFTPSLITQHPLSVTNFYRSEELVTFRDNLSCCKGEYLPENVLEDMFAPFGILDDNDDTVFSDYKDDQDIHKIHSDEDSDSKNGDSR